MNTYKWKPKKTFYYFRWLQSKEKKTLTVKHLHKVLYIVNIGLNDDFETQKPAFSKALEEYGIFNLLKQVITYVPAYVIHIKYFT